MIHLILTYMDDCDTTGVDLFHTKQDALEYVLEGIRRDWEDCLGVKDEEDRQKMEAEVAEARKSLDERGCWRDAFGNTYVYDEKDFTK